MSRHHPLLAALAAALVMAVAMGFGRFAFTGIYPLMVSDGVLSVHAGSIAASVNYAGYLLGALLAVAIANRHAYRLCLGTLAATVLALAALGVVDSTAWIILIRGLAGVFSALAMVGASVWLLQNQGVSQGAPVLYAGVGVGVLVSAELLAAGQWFGLHSHGLWLLLALSATVLSLLAVTGMHGDISQANSKPAQAAAAKPITLGISKLILVYGLAGFGYIVTATFLPLLVSKAVAELPPIQVWAVFGLGAAPSCFLWQRLMLRWGTRTALFVNLAVQAIGVVLPVFSATPLAYLASAVIVGGTFMGTATIALSAASRLAASVRFNLVAAMTAAYGVGQIAGPAVANYLYASSQSFSPPLAVAGAVLTVAAALCVRLG
ncbi:MAG: YbfB/YjiJ family MFS transporter [Pseudomonas sp.]